MRFDDIDLSYLDADIAHDPTLTSAQKRAAQRIYDQLLLTQGTRLAKTWVELLAHLGAQHPAAKSAEQEERIERAVRAGNEALQAMADALAGDSDDDHDDRNDDCHD